MLLTNLRKTQIFLQDMLYVHLPRALHFYKSLKIHSYLIFIKNTVQYSKNIIAILQMRNGAQRGSFPSATYKINESSNWNDLILKCVPFCYPTVVPLKLVDLLAFWLWESHSDPLCIAVFICIMGMKIILHRGAELVLESYIFFSRKWSILSVFKYIGQHY